MVLCWLTSSGTSELCCHIHACVSLFSLSPPAMSSAAHAALSCSAPSLTAAVASGKMLPIKQIFSATSSLFSPSTTCPKAALLRPNDQAGGKRETSRSAQSPAHLLLFLPRDSHKSKTASLLLALHRNPITDTISLLLPQTFYLIGIVPYSYPSPLYSPLSLPHKNTAMLSIFNSLSPQRNPVVPLLLHASWTQRLCFSFEEQPLQLLQPSPVVCEAQSMTTLFSLLHLLGRQMQLLSLSPSLSDQLLFMRRTSHASSY